MRWVRRARNVLRVVFGRRRLEREIDAELRFHLASQIEENMAAGLSLEDARASAMHSLGPMAAIREGCRDSTGATVLDEIGQDVRYCLRALRRSPGFGLVAVLSLAASIAVNTTVLSVAHAVLLKPLPYHHANRLVRLAEYHAGAQPVVSQRMLGNLTFDAWRRAARTLDALAAYAERAYTVTGAGDPTLVQAKAVSPALFRMLDVSPAAGRFFEPGDEVAGADRLTVLSYEFWQQRLGGAVSAIGSTIDLDAHPYVIVGVAPPGFSFPSPGNGLYTPLAVPRGLTSDGQPRFQLLSVVGRLAPGVTAEQAEAEGTAVARSLGRPPHAADMLLGTGGAASVRVRTLIDDMTAPVRPILVLLSIGVVLVLLVGCANVANLFLARGVSRARELAVRAALGASRGRIVRQLMTESLAVAGMGGVVGGLAAWGLIRALPAIAPSSLPRLDELRFDTTTAIVAVAVTILAGFLAGVAPALQKMPLLPGLREGSGVSAEIAAVRARRILIVAETACAAVLLIGSALLVRSFIRLVDVDTGYDASNVIAARISMQAGPNTPQRWRHVAGGVLDRVRAIPGVESAGASSMAPLGNTTQIIGFRLAGDRPEPIVAYGRGYVVTPGYAETLRLRLRKGRLLSEADVSSATEAMVVNERFVSEYLSDGAPIIGRRYSGLLGPNTTQEIVGVVGNVLKNGFADRPQAEFYVALGNEGATGTGREMNLVIRTVLDPGSLVADLRSIVHQVDPTAPIYHVTTLSAELSATAGQPRFAAMLFAAFGALAACLAAVGLYGVLAYGVSQRRRELGVRTALGASRSALMMLVLTEGMGLAAAGIAAGVVTAAAGATLLRAVVFDIGVHDLVSFAAGPIVLAVVALCACAVPARRATSLDAVAALRSD